MPLMNDFLEKVMAAKTAKGLKLTWLVPGRPADIEPFTEYAKDEAHKARLIASPNRKRDGWVLIPNAEDAI
jgi:hypothetical protein